MASTFLQWPLEIRSESRFQMRLMHRPRVAIAVFALSASLALTSLVRAGAFSDLAAWLNYEAWINARWRLFASLSFFEFVNIYTITPLCAAWVLLSTRSGSLGTLLIRLVPTFISVGFALATYQKKAALVCLGIVFASWLLFTATTRPRLVLRGVLAALAIGLIVYVGMIVVPTANAAVAVARPSQRDRPALISPITSSPASSQGPQSDASVPPEQLGRVTGTTVYALVATLMRTSAPALYYPVVFPAAHPFYPLDLGQDVICSPRLGCDNKGMPDENLVVWDFMNPNFHGGSVTAPFQFALYSQGGLAPALIGSLVLGFVLGTTWRLARSSVLPPVWSALAGSIILLLAANLAVDSARNSVLVSYGALWGALFLAACGLAIYVGNGGPSRLTQIPAPSLKSPAR